MPALLHGSADFRGQVALGAVGAAFHLDPLAAWYLGIIGLIGLAGAPYLATYMGHLRHSRRVNMPLFWTALTVLMLSMALVVMAANVQTFLVAWEAMSISSFLLVATDHEAPVTRQAALIYLSATRIGTALIAIGFLWAHAITGSWYFASWHLSGAQAVGPGLLVLAGLGVKAGMWPFHVWLSISHPVAPAPVSALMSGVMVKTAVAVIIRLFLYHPAFTHPSFGYVLLCLGAVGAVWGILFALMQQDLKRLLALSTVENIGLILFGIGGSIIARAAHMWVLADIALAAALFHSLNHAVFKSLLFMGAGSVDMAAGTRDFGMLGGLGRRMPRTFACFLVGGAAICALPPLNGFASKWLMYQGALAFAGTGAAPGLAAENVPLLRFAALAMIAVLSLVGALSLACFVKAIGVGFLGRPRSTEAEQAREVGTGMRASQTILAMTCVGLGLAAPVVLTAMQPIVDGVAGSHTTISLSSVWNLPIGAFVLVTAATFALLKLWLDRAARTAPVRQYVTWDCGFGSFSARAQVSAISFVQPIARMFGAVYHYVEHIDVAGSNELFPDEIIAELSSESVFTSKVYHPAARWFDHMAEVLLRLQEGSIHRYLATMAITLLILLVIGGYVK